MARYPQGPASRGSQKWLQVLVNKRPELIDKQIADLLGLVSGERIHWLSPLEDDEYAEYRDNAFIKRLDCTLDRTPLKEFWPRLGPQWDGLAKSDRGDLILVEAKSHIPELLSSTGAGTKSLKKIRSSLDMTRDYLRSQGSFDWTTSFYQYANRLAHLYLLRILNGLPAYVLFVCFINDHEMDGPTTSGEWHGATYLIKELLGIDGRHNLSQFVVDAFVDVTAMGEPI